MPKERYYMRKIFGVLLSVLCICCAAIGLTGCKKDKHIHAFDKQVITDEYKATDATCTEAATYYYSCECGEKGTETFEYGSSLGHSFTNYVSDNNATCTEDGTKTAVCDRDGCNEKDTVTDMGSKLPHTFDKKVANEKYLASAATCTESAKYYYSCSCGEKGTETFTSGNALGHSFTNYVSDNNATCTEDGTKTAKCDRCDKKNTVKDIDSKLHHRYTEQIVSDEYLTAPATCNKKATYYYSCKCGATGIETFEYGSITNHNFVNGSCTYCGKKQETSRGLAFTLLYDGTYKVRGIGSCTDTEIVIPSVYNDKPVTSIGDYAFLDCSGLTSITIPNSVTSIGEYAFYGCRGLTSVTIPDSVTSIGDRAFVGCKYIANINISSIESWCKITGLNNLMGEGLSNKKLYINGKEITELIIPDSVTKIESATFRGCNGLTSVTIGNSVTSIGDDAFYYCSGIESLVVTEENKKYHSANNCIIETGTKQLIVGCKTSIIPSDGSVTSIGNYAFSGCNGLTCVTIPDSVTSIGYEAFYYCSGLTSVTIPNSVTSIGNDAFYYCSGLKYNEYNNGLYLGNENNPYVALMKAKSTNITSCTINANCKIVYSSAFRDCSGLTSVTIPDSVTFIGDSAFYNCSGLTSVTIPDRVTSIGYYAFYNCSGLTSITIGNSVTSIGYSAFMGCRGLKYNEYDNGLYLGNGNNPYIALIKAKSTNITSCTINANCKIVCSSAFERCSGLTSVTIPDSVTSIGNSAFWCCSGLTSVTIGNSVTSIGDLAFYECSGIKSLVVTAGNKKYHSANNCIIETGTKQLIVGCKTSIIPSDGSVTSIGDWAFRDCSGLTSVTIPDSVTSIGDWAFYGCRGLTSVTIGNSVTSIGNSAFGGCRNLISISFTGTIADWKNIDKGSYWNNSVPTTCVIHCTDGDIKISD